MSWRTILIIVIALYLVVNYVVRRSGKFSFSMNEQTLREKLTSTQFPTCLLDVRTVSEYCSGHIPTAVNLPYDTITVKPPEVDPDSLIVLYCESGSRSSAAKTMLKRLGFTNVVNFGSVNRWRGPLVAGSEPGDIET